MVEAREKLRKQTSGQRKRLLWGYQKPVRMPIHAKILGLHPTSPVDKQDKIQWNTRLFQNVFDVHDDRSDCFVLVSTFQQ